MDLDFTPDQLEFRDQVRTWLDENKPAEPRPRDDAGIREYDLAWQRTQAEGGWAGIAWPTEYGGKGLTLLQQLIWYEEYAARGFPGIDACFVGNSHAGPTLITRATDEQKSFHLPKILGGEVIWCQGFSEPDAGSDLAALRTKAIIDGEHLVVSGQKLWTSFATVADYQELLVRTDNTGSKHKGITWVICDMSTPGIDVRPIETIEGGSEFCEVFYDDVRIPLSNVVGEVGEGWSVAMATLSFERGTAFTANQVRLAKIIEDLIDYARDHVGPDGRRPAIADDDIARRLARARASVASLRALTYTNICEAMKTETPGPRGSIVKLMYAELAKEIGKLAMDVIGPASSRYSSRWDVDGWAGYYYYSFSQAIGGGTSEIQRNIVGERVLGLPDEHGEDMVMNLLPGAEQLEIVSAAGEFLAERMPVERIRANRHADAPIPGSLWRECAELGLLTLGLDEESGGSGRPLDDEALLFVELGKRLAPGPFLACTLGARVAARCGDDALAQRIGSGAASVALAVLRGDGDVRPVKGTFDLFEPTGASHALLVARSGAALVDIDSFGPLAPVIAADPGTRISTATVESAEPLHWLPVEDEWIWARAMVLTAGYLTGLAAAAAASATEHAKTREQFGKPIGVHQAIKHACVDMEIAAEAAQAQTFFAAIAVAGRRADALLQVLSAVTVAGSAAVDNAAVGIHVFGGMGYTFENDMHLYLKRAHVFRHLFGEPTDVLAELLAQDRAQ